jgi:hypothetical protein
MPNKVTYTITTGDGKEHQVSKENVDKYGIQSYADAYKGATIRMRDAQKGDYDIPLQHFDNARKQGLHAFSLEHTPVQKQAAPKPTPTPTAKPTPSPSVNPRQSTPQVSKPLLSDSFGKGTGTDFLKPKPVGYNLSEEHRNEVLGEQAKRSATPSNPHVQGAVQLGNEAKAKRVEREQRRFGKPTVVKAFDDAVHGDKKAAKELGMPQVMQQKKDEIDYMQATGKELRNPVDAGLTYDENGDVVHSMFAPTVARDEHGNIVTNEAGEPLVGISSDEARAKAYGDSVQTGIEAQREKDKVDNLYKDATESVNDAFDEDYKKKEDFRKEHPFLGAVSDALEGFSNRGNALQYTPEGAKPGLAALGMLSKAAIAKNNADRYGDAGTLSRLYGGIMAGLTDVDTYDFGITDTFNAANLYRATKNYEEGKATAKDKMLLDAAAIANNVQSEASDRLGGAFGAGQNLVGTIGFMAQMATNPASGVGKEAAASVAKTVAKRALQKFGKGAIAKAVTGLAKGAARVGMDAVEAGVVTGMYSPTKIVGDYLNRKTGDVQSDGKGGYIFQNKEYSDVKALAKAINGQYAENISEMWGEYLPGVGKVNAAIGRGARKIGLGKVVDAFEHMSSSNWAKTWKNFQERTKWNGMAGEYFEEVANNLYNAVTNGDMTLDTDPHTGVFNPKINLDTFYSVALMSGIMSGVNTAGYARERYKAPHEQRKADAQARSVFGERWDEYKNAIDNADEKQIGSVMEKIGSDKSLSSAQKIAALQYQYRTAVVHGVNAQDTKNKLEGQFNAMDEAYSMGYNLQDEKELNNTAILYDEAKKQAIKATGWGEDTLESMIGEDGGASTLAYMKHSDEFNDGQLQAFTDYANARAAYNGMIQRVKDDIDTKVHESNLEVEQRTNLDTGAIHPATMKVDDRQVYIVNGNVVMLPDGSGVDHEHSDDFVVLRDAETGEPETADPSAISKVDAPINAQEEKETAADNIRQTFAQQQADKIDGKLEFKQGDTYPIIDKEDGTQHSLSIIGDAIDEKTGQVNPEMVLVDIDGAQQPILLPKEQVQQQVDEARRAAVAATQVVEHAPTTNTNNTYSINDEVTLSDENGNTVRGSITASENEDGKFEVYTEQPINGKKVNLFSAEELDAMTKASETVTENATVQQPQQQEETEDSVEKETSQQQTTALERIPKDESGQPLYEQTEPETAWDAIVEQTEGDTSMAQTVADDMVSDLEAGVKKAEKTKTKSGGSIAEKIAAEKERAAVIEQAKATLAHWRKIAAVNRMREAAIQAEEQRKADEMVRVRKEQEEKERVEQEEAERIKREALNGVPDFVEDKATDARARGYRRVNGDKVDRQEPINATKGKEVQVKFDDDNIPTGHVAIIEANQLQPSHKNGQRNPQHFIDEAQPKERKDDASVGAARKIAANIRPEEITSSITAYTGAPTVNSRGEVIQGNNRSAALREMWDNHQEQGDKYKQYLIDHAESFGLRPEDIAAMDKPVLVNMLDVNDDEAISLGQFVASDTESGGTERIKPKNVVKKLGDKMKNFANILLRANDENISFAELVDSNGVDALKWLNANGVISPTQYKSAFDSKGNITAEAKNDIKGIMYQSIFEGGNTQLEEMFNALPAKAQKAILATAYRDYDSPQSERMIGDIQDSIMAYYALSHDSMFMNAKNHKDARIAVEAWRRQLAFDDVTGESYLPAEKYSNFALLLATMYKGDNQSLIQGTFNKMYDLIQGTQEETLFEQPDNTPRSLAQAIKETLNIEYNGQQGSNVLAGDNSASQEGRTGSNGDATSRGRSEDIDGAEANQGGTKGDTGRSGSGQSSGGSQKEVAAENSHLTKKEAADFIAQMELGADVAQEIPLTIENWDKEFGEDGIVSTPIGDVKMGENQFAKLMRAGRNGKLGMLKPTLEYPDAIVEENSKAKEGMHTERPSSFIFIKSFRKSDGTRYYYFTSITVSVDGKEVVVSNQEKSRNRILRLLMEGSVIWRTPKDATTSSAEKQGLDYVHPDKAEGETKGSVITPQNTPSVGKDKQSSATKQEIVDNYLEKPARGEDLFAMAERVAAEDKAKRTRKKEEAKVDTNPTEAQKEAGNYKKGHIKVDGFNVTIEQPKGSVRRGNDANGKEWKTEMHNTYGYIRGTESVDGDHIDIFLSDNPTEGNVFVVDQVNKDGSFDEHKVMYGFSDMESARKAYLSNYEEGWQGLGNITEVSKEEFKKWIDSSKRKIKPFAEYSSVKTEGDVNVQHPIEDKGSKRLVSNERYEELKKRMRSKLGQLNLGVDPEMLAIGAEMAVYHIENGARAFGAYAKEMISDLGDAIRPYLKAFYNGARDLPEMTELSSEMTPYDEVSRFDVATIGNEGEQLTPSAIETAEQINNEATVEFNAKQEQNNTNELEDVDNDAYSITKQHNNKKDVDIWVVRGKERTDKDIYTQRKQVAKEHNGYYSSFRGVNGFVFNSAEEAHAFADAIFNTQSEENYTQNSEEIMRKDILSKEESVENQENKSEEEIVSKENVRKAINAYEEAQEKFDNLFSLLVKEKESKPFDSREWREVNRTKEELKDVLLQLNTKELGELLKQVSEKDTEYVIKNVLDIVNRKEHRLIAFNAILDKQSYITPEYKEEKKAIPVSEFVETDKKRAEIHTMLTGVFHDKGYVVGTDAHLLLARKEDYDKSLEGKVTNKKGEVINGKYPNWRAVVNSGKQGKSWGVNLEELHAFTRGVLTKLKTEKANPSTKKDAKIAFKTADGKIVLCYANALDKALQGAKSIGAKSFFVNDDVFAITQTTKGYVICPMLNQDQNIDDNSFAYVPRVSELQHSTETLSNDTEAKQLATGGPKIHQAKKSQKDINVLLSHKEYIEKELVSLLKQTKYKTLEEWEDKDTENYAQKYDDILETYKDYVRDLADDEKLQAIYDKSSVKTQKEIREHLTDADLDYHEFINTSPKRLRIQDRLTRKSKYAKGEFSDGAIVSGEVVRWSPTSLTVNSRGTLYTISANKVLEQSNEPMNADGHEYKENGSLQYSTEDLTNNTTAKQLATDTILSALNKAGIEVVRATDEQVQELLANTHATSLRTPQGTIYGWAVDGKIYLTEAGINPDTPIHEYTHLWAEAMMSKNKQGWNNIKTLLKGTSVWEEVVSDSNYSNITNDEDAVASEVLSRISGRENAARMVAEAQKVIDEDKDVFEKAKFVTLLNRIKRALDMFWKWVGKELFKIKKFGSINEVTDRVLYDLMHSTKLISNDKSLIGVHNISEQKLRKVLKQGGFANPSIAVIDTDKQVHNDYGEISLILPSRKINKSTGKNAGTFEGDAWTPMYPVVEKQISSDGGITIHNDINAVPKDMQSEVRNALNRWLENGSDTDLSYLYLFQQGKAPQVIVEKPKYSNEVYKTLNDIMFGVNSVYNLSKNEIKKLVELYIQTELDGNIKEYNEAIQRKISKYEELIKRGKPNSLRYRVADSYLEDIEKYGYPLSPLINFVNDVQRDKIKQGSKNAQKTLNTASQIIKDAGLEKDFKNWVEGLNNRYQAKEVIFDGFTPTGKRRYIPNTLENVSKIMKKQGRQASAGISISFSNFAAAVMKANGSLDNIRKKKSKLTNEHKDIEDFEEKWKEVYFDLAMKLQPNANMFDDYGFARLQEAANEKNPQTYIRNVYGITLSEEDVQKLQDLVKAIREERPALYFETKFERPVYLNEFSKAVVPEDFSDDLQNALRESGIEVFTYKRGDVEDRQRVTKQASYSSNDIAFQVINNSRDGNNTDRFTDGLNAVNEQFNRELAGLTEENADTKIFNLGSPSSILLSAGVEDKPMKLYGSKLMKKAKLHSFSPKELQNLPAAVAAPIAVFDNYKKTDNRSILTELKTKDGNFLVSLTIGKGIDVDFNIIASAFGKANGSIIKWINKGFATYINKEKALNYLYLSAPIAEAAENSELSSAAKIVKDFVNPNIDEEKLREGYGLYTNSELSFINDPVAKMLGKSNRSEEDNKAFAERERQRMISRISELADRLHLDNIETVTNSNSLQGKKAKAKGFYSKSSGKITIVIPNHASVEDVEKTLLHEAVAHYGLRKLFGEHFETFLDNVYQNVEPEIRRIITSQAANNNWDFRTATEEYLAGLAERTDFERVHYAIWNKIKSLFLKMLHSIGFEGWSATELSDNELRYLLWRSYENMKEPGRYRSILGEAEDVAKQNELKVGNYDQQDTNSSNVAERGILYREDDSKEKERVNAREKYEQRVNRAIFQTQEALQDSMLGLKEAMNAITKAEGKNVNIEDIDGYENAYLGENRLSSVNKAEADAFAHLLFKPMLAEVAKLCKKAQERAELVDYMMAKHGLERNAVMRKRAIDDILNNEKLSDAQKSARAGLAEYRDYAGLTALTGKDNVTEAEVDAETMVSEYENTHDTTNLWDKVNAVNAAILSKSYECGMMDKDTYEKISDMYKYYIPLRGFDETTSEEAYAYLLHQNSAFNAPIKVAKGRSSKADDPFANMQSMAESAITQGNRNKLVKQRFFNFVLNHPSDLVSISDIWLKYDDVADEWKPVFPDNFEENDSAEDIEQKLKEFEDKMKTLAEQAPDKYKHGKETANIPYRVVDSRDLRQHQVLVKRGGRDYILTLNGNPRAAQALNGQTNPDNDTSGAIGAILKAGEMVNRQLSAFYTTRNPDFVVSNFIRDMLFSNSIVWVKESPNYALRFHRNIARCNPAQIKVLLAKHRKGTLDMNNKLEHMFYQFMMNGGETGYANVRDIEQHKNDIRRELKRANGKLSITKAFNLLGEKLDEYNRAVENCARFAAYLTSREMGRTVERSIYDAKEISVNFNKKGSGAKFMNAVGQTKIGTASAFVSGIGRSGFVFWNAAIQGTTNFGRQFKKHPAKAFTASAIMFLLGAVIAGIGMGDGDDDADANSYWNLPEYVRRSNILFKIGDQWVSIPLPVEYRAIYGMGELMVSAMSGKEHFTGSELGKAIAGQATQVLPIDFLEGGGGVKAFVPSAVKPFAEVYSNKGWTGMPIYKDTPYNKYMPEWTKAYKSANKYLVGIAKTLNETTGGDAYTKGSVDINPAQIEYLLNGYFGGVSGTIDKLSKSAETIAGDREYDPRNFLLLNRILKNGDERTEARAINNEYMRVKEEHDVLKARMKHYENDSDKGIFDYADKIDFLYNSPEFARYEIFEDYSKDIDALYQELKEANDGAEHLLIEKELTELKKEMIEEMNKTRK